MGNGKLKLAWWNNLYYLFALHNHKQIAVTAQPDGVVCVGLQAFPSYPGEL